MKTNMNAKISEAIIALLATGLDIRQAFDAVLGPERFEQLAGEIYDRFNDAAALSSF